MPDIFVGETAPTLKTEKEELNKDISSHAHLFASYCEKPPKVSFTDKIENEEILLFLRKHFVTNIPWILKAIGLAGIPILLSIVSSFNLISVNFLPVSFIAMTIIFYYLFVTTYIFVNYITWFYNISLVTTLRIIDIDFSQIVFENVNATKLTQVEDVGYVQIGVIRSIFDYGDVHVHTAGPVSNFESHAVPHPERVVKIINNLLGEATNA